jgi:hypothetical protein
MSQVHRPVREGFEFLRQVRRAGAGLQGDKATITKLFDLPTYRCCIVGAGFVREAFALRVHHADLNRLRVIVQPSINSYVVHGLLLQEV